MELEPQLQQLLKDHPKYFTLLADGKIKCEVNGHHFPPKHDVLSAFIK